MTDTVVVCVVGKWLVCAEGMSVLELCVDLRGIMVATGDGPCYIGTGGTSIVSSPPYHRDS